MKVIWNLDKTKAIPINYITEIEIISTKGYTQEFLNKINNAEYAVLVRTGIFGAGSEFVYAADTEGDCVRFVENI